MNTAEQVLRRLEEEAKLAQRLAYGCNPGFNETCERHQTLGWANSRRPVWAD